MKLFQRMKFRKDRYWDLLSAVLIVIAFWAVSNRLVLTDWSAELYRVQVIAFCGTLSGLALGYSRFSRGAALFFGFVYGLILIIFQLGMFFSGYVLWHERLYHLLGRFSITFTRFISQQKVSDLILFNIFMFCLLWGLAIFAGYFLTRKHNAWAALLPAGVFLVAIQNFDGVAPFRMWYLAFYLIIWLVLSARVYHQQAKAYWTNKRIKLPLYFNWDMLRYSALFIAVLVIFAWITPVVASTIKPIENVWDTITSPFEFLEDQFNNAFFPLQKPGFLQNDYYGSELPLGNGNYLSDQIVLNVSSPHRNTSNIRYYWRVRIYDTYLDGSWSSTSKEVETVAKNNFRVFFPEYIGRSEIAVSITPGVPLSTLYTLPQPRQFNTITDVTFTSNPDGSADVVLVKPDKVILPGDSYEVQASVSSATIAELFSAGSDYPDWVIERYLSVPESISDRTRDLSVELSEGRETPYEIAQAITEYLRENIEYSETVEEMPRNQDPIDWFLFDYQQGFCNYYASSMIMLLRLQGIPARMAVGYAQGERVIEDEVVLDEKDIGGQNLDLIEQNEASDELFVVRQRDAHAWPEVFFPGIGWVEFEPTANQIPLIRTQGNPIPEPADEEADSENNQPGTKDEIAPKDEETPLDDPQNDPALEEGSEEGNSVQTTAIVVGASIAVLAVIVAGWRTARARGGKPLPVLVASSMERIKIKPPMLLISWAKDASLPSIAKAYQQINKALKRLKVDTALDLTPAERAQLLQKRMPEYANETGILLEQYEKAIYSPHEADLEIARESSRIIAWQSRLLWFRSWFTRFQEETEDDRGTLLELN